MGDIQLFDHCQLVIACESYVSNSAETLV
jgi:hypothetical protein